MLTKTSLFVFIIFVGQLGYIVMSDSEYKNRNIYFLKKNQIHTFFVARTKTSGVEVIVSYSVGFHTFIYFEIW